MKDLPDPIAPGIYTAEKGIDTVELPSEAADGDVVRFERTTESSDCR
ncbi:hypothetical protein [Halospeciosus flavus]